MGQSFQPAIRWRHIRTNVWLQTRIVIRREGVRPVADVTGHCDDRRQKLHGPTVDLFPGSKTRRRPLLFAWFLLTRARQARVAQLESFGHSPGYFGADARGISGP